MSQQKSLYNIPLLFTLKGKLDIECLQTSLNTLMHRHEILRLLFCKISSELQDIITTPTSLGLEIERYKDIDWRDQTLKKFLQKEVNKTFDLFNGRAKLLTMEEDKYILTIVMHHIISDEWSSNILMN